MEATPRMKQILQILLKEQAAVSVKYIAEQIGVSKRTVQRELGYVSGALEGYEIRFLSKTGVGIWLEGGLEEKERLLLELQSETDYDASNREERRKRLIREILKEKGIKKLFHYSSQFGVSEATVSTDLEAAETWLGQYGLLVSRKPGSGISVEGSEKDYRRAIRGFIGEFGQILNDDITNGVMGCINRMEEERLLSLTESSYVGLIIHISIAVNRILKGEVIEADERWKRDAEPDEDYRLAMEIAGDLEQEFQIRMPEVEVAYICLHIKGAKHEKIEWKGGDPIELGGKEIQQLVNDMIDAFDREKAYLLKQDDEFIQGLLAHLQPTLIRLIHGMHIRNPVLSDIQENYPDIFERCRSVADVLQKSTGKEIPDEETGFLTVHFGAAMVRMEGRNEKIRRVHAGVVCSSGIGISRLMSSKLKKVFRDRLELKTYGKNDITPYVAAKQDFFITSIPIENVEIPVIDVNPLLGEEDIERIRRMVYQYERLPEKQKEADTFSIQLEKINLLAAQIKTIIHYMEFFKVDNRITFEELLIAVGEKLSPYSDRREMIREDIMRRERIASQIFAEFGFALLHTRTKGVTRPSFGVCVTKDKGRFEDPYFKGIGIVFIMLIPQDENLEVNREIMGYISSMLIEEYEFMKIIKDGQKEEIRDALSGYLKKYFNSYLARLS